VSGRSPNWSVPPSARRISNANATRVTLLEISRPVFRFVAITRAFFLSQTLPFLPLCPRFLVLPLLSFLSSFSFRYTHFQERKSRHSRHFRFSRLDCGLNFAVKFLSVIFCGEHKRDRGNANKTTVKGQFGKASINFADLTKWVFFYWHVSFSDLFFRTRTGEISSVLFSFFRKFCIVLCFNFIFLRDKNIFRMLHDNMYN